MGTPTSSIFSEIYLQYLENTTLSDILIRHTVLGYFRYVNDILIIYKEHHTDIHHVFNPFNNATPTLSFTMVTENNNSIDFLDITIYKTNNLVFCIYRKPTATDHIIPHDSNHPPPEHKLSAINYLSCRLITYPLHDIDKQQEYKTIKCILYNNKYNSHTLDKSINTITTKLKTQKTTLTSLQTHHEEQTIQQQQKKNQNGPPSPT